MSVSLKAPEDIAKMRVAERLAAELLDFLEPHVQAGIATGELDRIAHDPPGQRPACRTGHAQLRAAGASPVSGVDLHVGQPRRLPRDSRRQKLKSGDIVNIDVTVIKDGWHGDTSRMFYIGAPSIQAKRLVEATYEAMCAASGP